MSTSITSYKPWQVGLAVVGAIGLIILALINAQHRASRPAPPEFGRIEDDPHEQAALKAVQAKSWAVRADWSGSVLTIEARGDGNRWDGYAMTACNVVREHTTQAVRIVIKDINTGATIGTSDCDW